MGSSPISTYQSDMSDAFRLDVKEFEGQRVINFANNSSGFVEVIFTVNGKEVKEGKVPDRSTRGYGYPPKLEKPVRKMKDGSPLRIDRHANVMAYVFQGNGSYKNEDLEKPTFLRHKLVDRFSFRRTTDEPIAILKMSF